MRVSVSEFDVGGVRCNCGSPPASPLLSPPLSSLACLPSFLPRSIHRSHAAAAPPPPAHVLPSESSTPSNPILGFTKPKPSPHISSSTTISPSQFVFPLPHRYEDVHRASEFSAAAAARDSSSTVAFPTRSRFLLVPTGNCSARFEVL